MFLLDIGLALLGVFFLGGFYVVYKNFREFQEDRYLDNKIGSWFGKQNYIFVQLFPPTENMRSLQEMEGFFVNLHSIFSAKSKKDIYLEGKWYDTFTFEIHSRGGQIGFFCRLNENTLPLFRSSLTAHYPGTGIIESPDPIGHWAGEWEGEIGPYKFCYGTDIALGKKDLFPLNSWKEFQRGSDAPTKDPINVLITSMEDVEKGDYIILQYVLTPYMDGGKVKEWKKDLQALKKEYTTNTAVETTENGQVQVLTKQEKDIIDAVESRIAGDQFKTKIRLLMLSDKPAPQRLLSRIMNFFKEYGNSNQFLKPAKETKSNISDDGSTFFGPFGTAFAPLLDKYYYKQEQKYRTKLAYRAAKRRSGSRGIEPTLMSAEILASLFHFPTTHLDPTNSVVEKTNVDYQGGTSVIQGGTPPANLPT